MTDFCLAPHVVARIERQGVLMSRMVARIGIQSAKPAGAGVAMLWCEARLKCVDCKSSTSCATFLDACLEACQPSSRPRAPEFCPNAQFLRDQSNGDAS